MLSNHLRAEIIAKIQELNADVFAIEVELRRGKRNSLIVNVDTDRGISMSECAAVSRNLGRWLEEKDVFDFSYNLEVSSPGIGAPLKLHRQYVKNIGRMLRVDLTDGRREEGKLATVTEEGIELLPLDKRPKSERGKRKKKKANEGSRGAANPADSICRY